MRQLVSHMVNSSRNIKSIMAGNGPQEAPANVLGDDPLATFDEVTTAAIAAFSAPGAMQKTVTTRRGEQEAGAYAVGQTQEMLVHGWDLAKAIGQDTTMDAELVTVQYDRALAKRERMRTTGVFGDSEPPVPENADLQSKYLALLGRSAV